MGEDYTVLMDHTASTNEDHDDYANNHNNNNNNKSLNGGSVVRWDIGTRHNVFKSYYKFNTQYYTSKCVYRVTVFVIMEMKNQPHYTRPGFWTSSVVLHHMWRDTCRAFGRFVTCRPRVQTSETSILARKSCHQWKLYRKYRTK